MERGNDQVPPNPFTPRLRSLHTRVPCFTLDEPASPIFVYRYPAGWELGARAALLHEGKGGSAAHGRREEIKG